MKKSKALGLMLAALVLGLALGNVAVGFAATDAPAATTTGTGLRLGAAMRDAGGRLADVVAKLTKSDVADVQEQREAGTSFASIAAKKDISSATVVSEALEVRSQILADRVKAGTITQEQADLALDRMKTRLTERVSATDDSCSGTGGMGGGMGGGKGQGQRLRDGSGGGMGGGRGAGSCVSGTSATQ